MGRTDRGQEGMEVNKTTGLAVIVLALPLLLAAASCPVTPPGPRPTPTPPPPTTTTTTTMPPQPHPVCTVEVERTVDCYHNPTGQQWLYACPLVEGVTVNVPWHQESTCPGVPRPPTPTPPPPPPTPAPGGRCVKQTGDHACSGPSELPGGLPGDFKDRVNKALSKASQCSVGSDCSLPNWQFVLVRTMELLEADGLCTSYDIDSGDCWKKNPDGTCAKKGLGSEMGVRNSLEKSEFYQPITANKKARWADDRSICRPAFDEETIAETKAWLEVTTPTPTPSPTPSPLAGCPSPVPGPLARWEAKIHNRGPNWWTLDSTPLVGPDAEFCKAIGFTDARRYCPPRAEGTPEAIIRACNELVVGEPANYPMWFWNGQRVPRATDTGIPSIEDVQHDENPFNPYHLLVRPGKHGNADVCGKGDVCGRVVL